MSSGFSALSLRSAKTYSQGDREVNIFTSFACPFGHCDIEWPRLSELLHTAQKDGNFNATKAKRIENPLKFHDSVQVVVVLLSIVI